MTTFPFIVKPDYVELPGSCAYRQPFTQENCVSRVYVLPANYAVLQSAVDHWLNIEINTIYDYVVLPWVALIAASIEKTFSTRDPDRLKGYSEESDVVFAVLLAAFRSGVIDHFAIAFPFVLVDNPITMSTGREVYGYRKSLGVYEYLPGTRIPKAAWTPAIKEFNPDAKQTMQQVLRIDNVLDDLATPGRSMLDVLAAGMELTAGFLRSVLGCLTGQSLLRHGADPHVLFHHLQRTFLLEKQIDVAYLLQLRDIDSCEAAAYQALLEAPLSVTSISDFSLLVPPTIHLYDYASYPVVRNLGLQPRMKPLLAFQAKTTFELMDGRVIAEGGQLRRIRIRKGREV